LSNSCYGRREEECSTGWDRKENPDMSRVGHSIEFQASGICSSPYLSIRGAAHTKTPLSLIQVAPEALWEQQERARRFWKWFRGAECTSRGWCQVIDLYDQVRTVKASPGWKELLHILIPLFPKGYTTAVELWKLCPSGQLGHKHQQLLRFQCKAAQRWSEPWPVKHPSTWLLFPSAQPIQRAPKASSRQQRGSYAPDSASPGKALNTFMHAPETSPARQHSPPVRGPADPDPHVHFSYQKKKNGTTGSQTLGTSALRCLLNWREEGRKGKSRP